MSLYHEYSNLIGQKESGNNYNPSPDKPTAGKHQFMWARWGNSIIEFARDLGIYISTKAQFESDPQLQEKWFVHYAENIAKPEIAKIKEIYGDKGLSDTELFGAYHFLGGPDLAKHLSGEKSWDENPTAHLNIENPSLNSYLSSLTGKTPSAYRQKEPKGQTYITQDIIPPPLPDTLGNIQEQLSRPTAVRVQQQNQFSDPAFQQAMATALGSFRGQHGGQIPLPQPPQYQDAGTIGQHPIIYTDNPKDFRLQAYQDSLNLHKASLYTLEAQKRQHQDTYSFPGYTPPTPEVKWGEASPETWAWENRYASNQWGSSHDKNANKYKLRQARHYLNPWMQTWLLTDPNAMSHDDPVYVEDYKQLNYLNSLQFHGESHVQPHTTPDIFHKTIAPTKEFSIFHKTWNPYYKKPEQEVIYEPFPKDNKGVLLDNEIPYKSVTTRNHKERVGAHQRRYGSSLTNDRTFIYNGEEYLRLEDGTARRLTPEEKQHRKDFPNENIRHRFTHYYQDGGEIQPQYQDAGQVSDDLRKELLRIADFEALMGLASGQGMSNFGIPGFTGTNEEAVDWMIANEYQKLNPFFSNYGPEFQAEALDFIHNAGKDQRIYLLDQYLLDTTGQGLPFRGDYNVDINRNPTEFEEIMTQGKDVYDNQGKLLRRVPAFNEVWSQHEPELRKLSENQLRIYGNLGKGFYYQNIGRQNNKPNPAYDNTWRWRINLFSPDAKRPNWWNPNSIGDSLKFNSLNQIINRKHGGTIQYQEAGNVFDDVTNIFPALNQMRDKVNFDPIQGFRDSTGVGSIDYARDPYQKITYSNNYVYTNPYNTPTIVYDPNIENAQTIALDMLHGLPDYDKNYANLRNSFADAIITADSGSLSNYINRSREEGNPDPEQQLIDNWIDGKIRGLLFEGTEEDFKRHRYNPTEREEYFTYPEVKRTLTDIENYLKTMQTPSGGRTMDIPTQQHGGLVRLDVDDSYQQGGEITQYQGGGYTEEQLARIQEMAERGAYQDQYAVQDATEAYVPIHTPVAADNPNYVPEKTYWTEGLPTSTQQNPNLLGLAFALPQLGLTNLATLGRHNYPGEAVEAGLESVGINSPGWLRNTLNLGLDPWNVVGAGAAAKGISLPQRLSRVGKAILPAGGLELDAVRKLPSKLVDNLMPKFKSEINWGKWNKEIPNNKPLMKEYLSIEQQAKANGTWMKNADGSTFQGTPEQFVQQQSTNFKTAFPEGYNYAYRGSQAFDPTLTKSMRGNADDHILFGSSDRLTAESYATNWGYNLDHQFKDVGKRPEFYHPDKHTPNVYDGTLKNVNPGIYQYAVDERLPKITGEGAGKLWDNVENKEVLDWAKDNVTDFSETRSTYKLEPDKVNTDNIASYMVEKNIPVGEVKNTVDSYSRTHMIPGNVLMINSKIARPKSLMYNNGMFDMNNPNIYKSIIGAGTIGTGLGLYNQKQGGEIPQYQIGAIAKGLRQVPKLFKRFSKFKPQKLEAIPVDDSDVLRQINEFFDRELQETVKIPTRLDAEEVLNVPGEFGLSTAISTGQDYLKTMQRPDIVKKLKTLDEEWGSTLHEGLMDEVNAWNIENELWSLNPNVTHPRLGILSERETQNLIESVKETKPSFEIVRGVSMGESFIGGPKGIKEPQKAYLTQQSTRQTMPKTVWHEIAHNINKQGDALGEKLGKALTDLFETDITKINTNPNATIDELQRLSDDAEYITSHQGTEVQSWLSTNLRQSALKKGLINDINDDITLEVAEKTSEWQRFAPFMKDKKETLKYINMLPPAVAAIIFGKQTYESNQGSQFISPSQHMDGGQIPVSERGLWDHPRQSVIVPTQSSGGRITMQGVDYPVIGIDELGNSQYMEPGGEYAFHPGKVLEIPVLQGGGAINYQDLLRNREQVVKEARERTKRLLLEPYISQQPSVAGFYGSEPKRTIQEGVDIIPDRTYRQIPQQIQDELVRLDEDVTRVEPRRTQKTVDIQTDEEFRELPQQIQDELITETPPRRVITQGPTPRQIYEQVGTSIKPIQDYIQSPQIPQDELITQIPPRIPRVDMANLSQFKYQKPINIIQEINRLSPIQDYVQSPQIPQDRLSMSKGTLILPSKQRQVTLADISSNGMCAYEGCAKFIHKGRTATTNSHTNLKYNNMGGHGWQTLNNAVEGGGEEIYSIFKEKKDEYSERLNNLTSNQAIKSEIVKIIDEHNEEPNIGVYEPLEGDLVGLFYPASEKHVQAFEESYEKYGAFNTHAGEIIYVDGVPHIRHNVNKKVRIEPLQDIIDGKVIADEKTGKPLRIAQIVRPKYLANPEIHKAAQKEEELIDYSRNVATKSKFKTIRNSQSKIAAFLKDKGHKFNDEDYGPDGKTVEWTPVKQALSKYLSTNNSTLDDVYNFVTGKVSKFKEGGKYQDAGLVRLDDYGDTNAQYKIETDPTIQAYDTPYFTTESWSTTEDEDYLREYTREQEVVDALNSVIQSDKYANMSEEDKQLLIQSVYAISGQEGSFGGHPNVGVKNPDMPFVPFRFGRPESAHPKHWPQIITEARFRDNPRTEKTRQSVYDMIPFLPERNVTSGLFQVSDDHLQRHGVNPEDYPHRSRFEMLPAVEMMMELANNYNQMMLSSKTAEQYKQLAPYDKAALMAYIHNRGISKYTKEGGLDDILDRMYLAVDEDCPPGYIKDSNDECKPGQTMGMRARDRAEWVNFNVKKQLP